MAVEYEVLPAVFDPEEAMAEGAPQLHGSEDPFVRDSVHNLLLEIHSHIGDVDAGFAAADVIHEGTYFSPRVQHAHLETHGSIAWMEDGRLNVRTSSQSPSIAKVKLTYLFALRPDQLRVFCKRVGGGFGGKQEVISEDLVALATLDTGRPVCFEFTREEDFTTASPRHPMKLTVKLGAKNDGTLTAFQVRNVSNTGAYGNHGGETLYAGGSAVMIYRCPNKKYDAFSVYTNTVPSGALRGYGMTQPAFAVESAMDELALALHMDPFELRRRNIVRPGDPLVALHDGPDDVMFNEDGLAKCIDLVVERTGPHGRSAVSRPRLARRDRCRELPARDRAADRAHLRGLGHARRRPRLRAGRRHRRIRRGHLDGARPDRGQPAGYDAVADPPGAVRHRPHGLRHRRLRERRTVRGGQRGAAGGQRGARPHSGVRRRAHGRPRRDVLDGRRGRRLRGRARLLGRARGPGPGAGHPVHRRPQGVRLAPQRHLQRAGLPRRRPPGDGRDPCAVQRPRGGQPACSSTPSRSGDRWRAVWPRASDSR